MDSMFGGGSGSFGIGRKKPVRKVAALGAAVTLPALAFNAPYWTMVFQDRLLVNGVNLKTRNQPWKYRGPLLAYTNSKRHQPPIDAYRIPESDIPQQVLVGCVNLADVFVLSEDQKHMLFRCYNNVNTRKEVKEALKRPNISAMDWGYAIDKSHQFRQPITLPKWPSTGSVAYVSITPEIFSQLPGWVRTHVKNLARTA